MAITKRVQQELVEAAPTAAATLGVTARPTSTAATRRRRRATASECSARNEPLQLTKAQRDAAAAKSKGKAWTPEEHQRFLDALELFPAGPWKAIADYIGTKNSRQTMTHAQKCREKHERKTRALQTQVKKTKKRSVVRRQPPRRRAASTAAAMTTRIQPNTQEHSYDDDDTAATDDGEDMDCQELESKSVDVSAHSQDEVKEDVDTSLTIVLDEATFFSGCEDALAATSVGSPVLVPLLSFPDPTLFTSDDLWQSQSLAEVALGYKGDRINDDGDATDLEDLHEFAVGLTQECW